MRTLRAASLLPVACCLWPVACGLRVLRCCAAALPACGGGGGGAAPFYNIVALTVQRVYMLICK